MNSYDCLVVGEVCIDLPIRPLDRLARLVDMETVRIEPIKPGGGGIVSNSGIALARLGVNAGALAYVGDDAWADLLTGRFEQEGLDTTHLLRHSTLPTSATAVMIGDDGEHTFAYHSGASRAIDKGAILDRLEVFRQTKFALLGYYSLLPNLEPDLPEVLRAIRETGCRTALDTAGGGGGLQPLDRMLPHLDIYIPSLKEGVSQTGSSDPAKMIGVYREFCPEGLLGIKLGDVGVLLSPRPGELYQVAAITPPGEVVDTTGAGDTFYAGLLTGLIRGLDIEPAARLGCAAGACCVTQIGAVDGIRSYVETMELAQLES